MKKVIFNYFAVFIDGILIEKQENNFKLLIFLFLLSFPLSYISLKNSLCKNLDLLSGILTFDGIVIGFLINFLVLYISLGNTKYLKKLKLIEYRTSHNNKKILIGKKTISVYQYLLSKIFFVVGIGLFLAFLIFISYISCYVGLPMFINNPYKTILKLIFSMLIIGMSLYFILYTYRLINRFYMLLFVYAKE